MIGFDRYEIENLFLENSYGIRGFGSRIGKGKQRLTLNIENVLFQNRSIHNFKSAIFSFFDIGIVGPSEQAIFKQNYYAGLGVGLRIRNENFVFKTIQFRLAYYPNHPSDLNSVGFISNEVSKNRFYNFQPRGPEPLRFE
jgi:hemolysin activation/secretion protein